MKEDRTCSAVKNKMSAEGLGPSVRQGGAPVSSSTELRVGNSSALYRYHSKACARTCNGDGHGDIGDFSDECDVVIEHGQLVDARPYCSLLNDGRHDREDLDARRDT